MRFLGLLHVRGELDQVSGSVCSAEDPERALINAVIPVATLRTGIGVRDRHLRGRHYFDAVSHPRIEFQGTGVRESADWWRIDGTAKVAGLDVPITFRAANSGGDAESQSRAGSAGRNDGPGSGEYRGAGVISRRALRLPGTAFLGRWLLLDDVVLGDEVRVEVAVLLRHGASESTTG